LGARKPGKRRVLALSLLLVLMGPFVMYYSIMDQVAITFWLGLAETALGMALALLRA
jgi:hypothetical protein